MKIAISSQGKHLDSPIDPRFGRASYFIIVDTETDEFTCHDNDQNKNATQGAGIQTASTLIDLGVKAVISGNLGPKAFSTLQADNIDMYTMPAGTVNEAVTKFKTSQLNSVNKASVEGRWV